MSAGKQNLVALRDEREKSLEVLKKAFADDLLDIDEYEQRVEHAEQAETVQALVALREDLLPAPASPQSTALATRAETSITVGPDNEDKRWCVAVLGGSERKGKWKVPRKLRALAMLGGIEMDFREAVLAPGENTVQITTVLGGVEIIVPPEIRVECDVSGILGGAEFDDQGHAEVDPDLPTLRITGLAVLGGVEITTRYAGESSREARKRRKLEKKAKKKALKASKARKQLSD